MNKATTNASMPDASEDYGFTPTASQIDKTLAKVQQSSVTTQFSAALSLSQTSATATTIAPVQGPEIPHVVPIVGKYDDKKRRIKKGGVPYEKKQDTEGREIGTDLSTYCREYGHAIWAGNRMSERSEPRI